MIPGTIDRPTAAGPIRCPAAGLCSASGRRTRRDDQLPGLPGDLLPKADHPPPESMGEELRKKS
jgi:hypothetical protein